MLSLPEQRSIGLIPPTQHQVEIGTTAIDLQLKIVELLTGSIGIPRFKAKPQVIEVDGLRLGVISTHWHNTVAQGFTADICGSCNQSQQIHQR
jgi:hypothetical protein